MGQRQKVELTVHIGDDPVALRYSADATAIVVENAVVTLEGSIEQRQALVMGMASALGLVYVQRGPVPVPSEPEPAEAHRKEEGQELFRRITSQPAPA